MTIIKTGAEKLINHILCYEYEDPLLDDYGFFREYYIDIKNLHEWSKNIIKFECKQYNSDCNRILNYIYGNTVLSLDNSKSINLLNHYQFIFQFESEEDALYFKLKYEN